MSNKKNIGLLFTVIVIFGSFLYGIISTQLVKNDLHKNGVIVGNVYLRDFDKGYRDKYYGFDCAFMLDSTVKELTKWSRARSNIRKNVSAYIGHSFPGVYSRRYNRMELLMLPEDFAKYGLPYPDSLRWVDSLHKLDRRW